MKHTEGQGATGNRQRHKKSQGRALGGLKCGRAVLAELWKGLLPAYRGTIMYGELPDCNWRMQIQYGDGWIALGPIHARMTSDARGSCDTNRNMPVQAVPTVEFKDWQ